MKNLPGLHVNDEFEAFNYAKDIHIKYQLIEALGPFRFNLNPSMDK